MLTDILDSFYGDPGIVQICLRLLCAMVVGIVIGTERSYTRRPAGMRTHVLVAVGACVVSMTGQLLFHEYTALGATPDPARLAAQVITGVGFLGAGTILREGANVKGLTTAASVWTVACLGIACGFGYYSVALCGMVSMLITLTILDFIQDRLPGRGSAEERYALACDDLAAALELIDRCAQEHRAVIAHPTVRREEGHICLEFTVQFPGLSSRKRRQQFFTALAVDGRLHWIREGGKEPV